MIDYTVDKPKYGKWNKSIVLRILFPPILIWDLLKLATNKSVGRLIRYMILPARREAFSRKDINTLNQEHPKVFHREYIVTTHDGAKLDTLEIRRVEKKAHSPEDKYIINFVNNGQGYENIIDDMQKDALELGQVVIGFNLRGVSKSTGELNSKDDLVIDGIAQVQRLLDYGVPSKNIILKGESLGAGIATLVAHHFHQKGQPIYIFNSRSFSSVTNFATSTIPQIATLFEVPRIKVIGEVLGWILKPFIKSLISLADWEINAGNAFKKIPYEYREYQYFRVEKSKRDYRTQEDDVIYHPASIAEHLRPERKLRKKVLKGIISNLESSSDYKRIAQEQLDGLKDRKLVVNEESADHSKSLFLLTTHSGKRGIEFFHKFVRRNDKNKDENTPIESSSNERVTPPRAL
jgi:hypothetical protein